MSNFFSPVLNICQNIAQTVLPQNCYLCGAGAGALPLCAACRADLPWHREAACPQCAVPSPLGEVCGDCLKHPPHFDFTVAALDYSAPADTLVHGLKFEQRLALAPLLADLLMEVTANRPRPDLLIPVPLSAKRLAERGFNQAREIVRHLGRRLDIPVDDASCQRQRHTAPQTDLPWHARRKNLRDAFACRGNFSGRQVVLVDDVMTTGATADALAKELKRAGAQSVGVWVIARTLKRRSHV